MLIRDARPKRSNKEVYEKFETGGSAYLKWLEQNQGTDGQVPFTGDTRSASSLSYYTPSKVTMPSRVSMPASFKAPVDPITEEDQSNFNVMGAVSATVPYLSNVVNRFRKIPKPAKPTMEQRIRPETVSFDASRNTLLTGLRTATQGMQQNVSSAAVRQGLQSDALARVTDANNQLAEQEANMNSRLSMGAKGINAEIAARNTERGNRYKDEKVARKLAQMNFDAANLADLTTKYGQQSRDNKMIDLEGRKIAMLPDMYESGAFSRQEKEPFVASLRNLNFTDAEIAEILKKKGIK